MTVHNLETCHHDATVAVLQERTSKFEKAVEEISASLKVTNSLLSTLAEQSAEIKHLREDTLRNERDIDGLFGRVRTLEIAPGRAASRVMLIGLTSAASCVGGTITGVMVFFMTKG